MRRDEERRVEEEHGSAGEEEGRDALRKGTENGTNDWESAGTEDPAFYLKSPDKE